MRYLMHNYAIKIEVRKPDKVINDKLERNTGIINQLQTTTTIYMPLIMKQRYYNKSGRVWNRFGLEIDKISGLIRA